jgi:long-chain fatty acid transport protein
MKRTLLAAATAAAFAPCLAWATDGYFQHGYGVKAQGMGGVGIALPQDALAAATNPAGMAFIGDRIDFGATLFSPKRGATITGNAGGPAVNGDYDGSGRSDFVIPEFGYNKMVRPNLALGISVYGNGGMNTSYTRPIPLFGTSNPGVDLTQLFISPTIAWKIGENNAIGASLNYAYQRFKAEGLQNFDNPFFSSSPGNVTNNRYDSSHGWGIRLGWTGKITDRVTLGATYQSKTNMGKFSKYQGLFAGQGGFDIPENYGAGIAVRATDKLTVAGDIVRINYGDVASVGDSLNFTCLLAGTCPLGASNGPGFGWRNSTAYKLGASYAFSQDLTLRAGYNWMKQPIPASQTFFNILAPGVEERHLTLGATWTLANRNELSVGYMHAFSKTVNGSGSINPAFGGGEANIRLKEDSLGVAYGWKM